MRMSRLLGATAVAVVLSAPAMAQTVIFQGTNPTNTNPFNGALTTLMILNQAGGFSYDPDFPPLNVDTIFNTVPFNPVSSRNNTSQVVQLGTINLNVVAPGVMEGQNIVDPPVGDFLIVQGAGNYFNPFFDNGKGGGSNVFGNTVASIVNVNGLWGTNPLLSSNIVSGSQVGQVNVNNVNFSTETITGEIVQQAGTDGLVLAQQPGFPYFGFGPVLSVDNFMVAVTNNGIAEVRGMSLDPDAETPTFVTGGQQAAIVNLNSIALQIGAPVNVGTDEEPEFVPNTVTLDVEQLLTGNNSIAVRNVAAAISLFNGSSTIDPSVVDIRQTAFASINSMSFTTPVSGVEDGVNQYAAANVDLFGVQNGIALGGFFGGYESYVRLGNVAAAVAGVPNYFGQPLNDPAMWLANPGSGIAAITNVQQVAGFQLNTITNPVGSADADQDAVGGVNLALSGPLFLESLKDFEVLPQPAFFQVNSGSDFTIVPVEFGGTNIVNLMVAGVGAGTATITDASQAFVIDVNRVDVGGSLTGGLIQHSYDVGKSGGPFRNYATAVANGAAKIDGLTQVMSQSYNSVSAGTLNNLYLNQLATDVALGNQNQAVVSSLSGAATLKDVIQVSSLNVNTIAAGTLLTGNAVINQSVRGVDQSSINLASVNTLQATGLSSAIQGAVQQSTINMNTILAK